MFKPDGTFNARKHLRQTHGLIINSLTALERPRESTDQESDVMNTPQVKGVVQSVNIDTFRYYLVRWLLERHIPFTVVKNTNFQAMLKSLNDFIQGNLVKTGDTVRSWVKDKFMEAKPLVQVEVLGKAILRSTLAVIYGRPLMDTPCVELQPILLAIRVRYKVCYSP